MSGAKLIERHLASKDAEIDRLTARIAELEKALKPLAQVPDKGAYPDTMPLRHAISPIRYGHVRFARTTLEASERGGGE